MKTFIYTLGIFALLVSPSSCSIQELDFLNNSETTIGNSSVSTSTSATCEVIDPTKPIPKP